MAVDLLEVHHEGERSADHQHAQDDVQDETKPGLLIWGSGQLERVSRMFVEHPRKNVDILQFPAENIPQFWSNCVKLLTRFEDRPRRLGLSRLT